MIRKLLSFMDFKEKRQFFLSVFVSILTILSGAALFGLSAFLIAFCGMRPPISDIMVAVVGVRFFGILRALLRYIERLVTHEGTFRIIGKIRAGLLLSLNDKNEEELEQLDKSDVLIKLVDDTERLQDFYLRTFQPLATSILCGIIGLILFYKLLNYNAALIFGIAYFGGVLIWPLISMLTTKKQIEILMEEQVSGKALLLEYFSNYMDISCNSAEIRWDKELDLKWRCIEQSEHRIAFVSSLTNGLNLLFINGAMAAILYMSWRYVGGAGMERLLIPVLALVIPALFEGTAPLTSFYEKFLKSELASKRVFDLMGVEWDRKPHIASDEENGQETFRNQWIEMKNVSFCPNENAVLSNINFSLKPGKKIGIIGPSGAGKTTIGKLLIGAIKPTEGEILGISNQEELFSTVNQNVFLFNTSIRNNLLIGNKNATEESIEEALRVVDMWTFCQEQPMGIYTEIGENGMRLSGGQRQRLAIARALLKDAPYFIMDEGTSGLDISTEKEILKRIFEKYKTRGLLVITHRLVMMEEYDELLVLKAGKIAERGTHEELVKARGWYSKVQNIIKNHLN